jgi:hypothetical protein
VIVRYWSVIGPKSGSKNLQIDLVKSKESAGCRFRHAASPLKILEAKGLLAKYSIQRIRSACYHQKAANSGGRLAKYWSRGSYLNAILMSKIEYLENRVTDLEPGVKQKRRGRQQHLPSHGLRQPLAAPPRRAQSFPAGAC